MKIIYVFVLFLSSDFFWKRAGARYRVVSFFTRPFFSSDEKNLFATQTSTHLLRFASLRE